MSTLSKQVIPYGMVPNSLLNHKEISLKAKGLFCFMQSKPEGWKFSVDMMSRQCKESKSAISEGLKELESFGYLDRTKKQSGSGFVVDYHLYFDPKEVKPIADFQSLEIQSLGNPTSENPMIGKSANNSKKEFSKKDISNKEESKGDALAFLQENYPSRFEILMMQYKKQINEYSKFEQLFEATVMQERLEFDGNVLEGRFKKFAINFISNQNRFDSPVIELNAKQPVKKIFLG